MFPILYVYLKSLSLLLLRASWGQREHLEELTSPLRKVAVLGRWLGPQSLVH